MRSHRHVVTGDATKVLEADGAEVTPGTHDLTGRAAAAALAGGGKGRPSPPAFPDSLSSFDLYVAGIGHNAIRSDTARARACFAEAVRRDSTYAPAYYELAAGSAAQAPDEAVALARKAYRLDTANLWYHRLYGQTLIAARRYGEALRVYRDLTAADAHDPDNFRLLAALYEEEGQPYAAIATLDTAELRFGRIPQLTAAKRRLLLATRQFGKALREAERIAADTVIYADSMSRNVRCTLSLDRGEYRWRVVPFNSAYTGTPITATLHVTDPNE